MSTPKPKVITVPQEEVEFKVDHPVTFQTLSKKFSFKDFALVCVRKYDFFGKGLENIMQGVEIVGLIKGCDEALELSQLNYDKFWKAVNARQWNQAAAEACLPFILAVRDAKEKEEKK